MNFARSLFTVSGLTVLSRIAGFIRDTLTAALLGAGPVADAFFVAQRLPNLFRSLFAEGAFSAAFVPLYTAEKQKKGQEAAQRFAGQALSLLLAILIPFSILIMLFMPIVIRVLAPGFEDDQTKYKLAVDFSEITFPYLALISITALQSGVMNAQGKFGPGAASPITFNLVLIAGLFLSRTFNLHAGYTLSWAVAISGVVQMLWLAISCYRAGVSIPLALPKLTLQSKLLFKRVGPGAIGAGAAQINILLSTILASTLPTGAVSYLFYADRLNQLPLGIVGIAVATTLLPLLSRHVEDGKHDHVRHYLSRAVEFCLMLGLPATVGLVMVSKPIIQTLFEHGVFSHQDTIATAQALSAYSLGIPAFLLVKVFAAGFFARQDTKTPVKVAVIAMATNVSCALLLLDPLHHIGIALANSLATWTNAILLYIQLRRSSGKMGDSKFFFRIPRILLCTVGMCLITAILNNVFDTWFTPGHLAAEVFALSAIIGVSSIAYGLLLQVTGAMRWQEALKILRRKPTVI